MFLLQVKKAEQAVGQGRYSSDLKAYNFVAFGVNALFHLLHLLNTHTTYDGLAQDTSISTSQSSVVMALCLVIILEYKERGLFFGWPTTRDKGRISRFMRWDYSASNIVRRYHGYAIGWAAIYTCWYHPMENTIGHQMGFFYTWILLLQVKYEKRIVAILGLEPRTFALLARRSNQLSYAALARIAGQSHRVLILRPSSESQQLQNITVLL